MQLNGYILFLFSNYKWCREDGARLFCMVPNARARGSGHKLEPRRCHLNSRKHFLTVQVTEHWHSFPREAVESPPWRFSKAACIRSWAACFGWPCVSNGWTRWPLGGPAHLNCSVILWGTLLESRRDQRGEQVRMTILSSLVSSRTVLCSPLSSFHSLSSLYSFDSDSENS